jgi:hypothetical protein
MARKEIFRASDFLGYVSQQEPEFSSTIAGATPEEIDRLQFLVGRPLPESYRQFLSIMGKDPGWIDVGDDHNTSGTTDIRVIQKWYSDYINKNIHHVPPNCIAISVSGPVFDVCLEELDPLEEPRVVFSEGSAVYEEYADTLAGLMFRLAFLRFQSIRWPYLVRLLSERPERLFDRASEWASSLGLAPLWFSDRCACCLEAHAISVFFRQYDEGHLFAQIGGMDQKEVTNLAEKLSQQLAVKRIP